MDADNTTGDLYLQFGNALNENIFWDADGGDGSGAFYLSDETIIQGKFAVNISNPVSQMHIYENSSSTDSEAGLTIENDGTGDSILQFLLTGAQRWIIGIDNTDSDKLKIARSTDLASNVVITFDTSDRIGIGTTSPDASLDIEKTGEVIELGNATASDITINFDNGTEKIFGWDDSEDSFSTFNEELEFRNKQTSSPPFTCSSSVGGMQWFDTDTGILYVCDSTNSRNKWLSVAPMVIYGDESGNCSPGDNPNNSDGCNVDWGNGLGPNGNSDLGFYIPHPITITAAGFSQDNDSCSSGSFDLEVWSTGSSADDDNYSLEQTLVSGISVETINSNSLNFDIDGDQYILWGIDNNCGQNIDDWNMVIYFNWRHD